MKARAALGLLLLLQCTGVDDGPALKFRLEHPKATGLPAGPLAELHQQGWDLVRAGQYLQAAETFEKGYADALKQGDGGEAFRFIGNAGNCLLAALRYRLALEAYREARRLAEDAGSVELVAAASSNISALYLQLGDLNAGIEAVEYGLRKLPDYRASPYGARLLLQNAVLHARKGDVEGAIGLFRRSIDEAGAREDRESIGAAAAAWDQLGYALLQAGGLEEAERALVEGFRLRKLFKLSEIQYSYYTLGMLRLAQGDAEAALRLLDRARETAAQTPGAMPPWRLSYQRGRAWQALGRLEEALAEFEQALETARRWRLEILPADSVRIGAEGELHQIYSGYIATAAMLYEKTGRSDLIRRAFQAAEENRAASLRELVHTPNDWQERLPEEYWQKLGRLRAAEAALVRADTPAARSEVARLHYELTEMEASGPPGAKSKGKNQKAKIKNEDWDESFGSFAEGRLLGRTRMALAPEEVLLSFHLGERQGFVWAVTRESVAFQRLPSRAGLKDLVARFQKAVRESLPETAALGEELYSKLFGGVSRRARAKTRWLLALDDVLFELPFAALVAAREGGRPVFLIERHSLQLAPSAGMVVEGRDSRAGGDSESQPTGGFIGVGDAVYNTADPRWAGKPVQPSVHLPRLAGSGREIELCARAWDAPGRATLIHGAQASADRLKDALREAAPVLHLAAHFVKSAHPREQALMALRLRSDGEPEFLSPSEISRWRLRVGVVVVSGCSSGSGEAPAGTGLMGMTRAWLAAGAGAVVASHWPTPDDSGELFISFYRQLRGDSRLQPESIAEALRRAQIDMLRSATWRALPKYWAAYFLVGKD